MRTLLKTDRKETSAVGIALSIVYLNQDRSKNTNGIKTFLNFINSKEIIDIDAIYDIMYRAVEDNRRSLSVDPANGLYLPLDTYTLEMKEALETKRDLILESYIKCTNIVRRSGDGEKYDA